MMQFNEAVGVLNVFLPLFYTLLDFDKIEFS